MGAVVVGLLFCGKMLMPLFQTFINETGQHQFPRSFSCHYVIDLTGKKGNQNIRPCLLNCLLLSWIIETQLISHEIYLRHILGLVN